MKKITALLVFMILVTSHSIFAQTKDSYLLKSSHQKTAAWLMLSGGTSLVIIGSLVELNNVVDFFGRQHNNSLVTGGILVITGGAIMLGSIPLFIAASKNKHAAMNLSFANQPVPSLVKNLIGNRSVPSLRLRLNL